MADNNPLKKDSLTPSYPSPKEPRFSLGNYFTPTTRNVLIWADTLKFVSVSVAASAFAMSSVYVFIGGLALGAIAHFIERATKQAAESTIAQALDQMQEEEAEPSV